MKLKKILKTDHFKVTQNFNICVGFYVYSSDLYKSSENNFFIKIPIGIILIYVVISVFAKMSLNFLRAYHRNTKICQKSVKNHEKFHILDRIIWSTNYFSEISISTH